jgi:hypothetical protein
VLPVFEAALTMRMILKIEENLDEQDAQKTIIELDLEGKEEPSHILLRGLLFLRTKALGPGDGSRIRVEDWPTMLSSEEHKTLHVMGA